MSDFGEVRSLLHDAEPSQEAFDRLLELLLHAEDRGEAERVWLPYALDRVKSWPDEVRAIELNRDDSGVDDVTWVALARTLDVSLFGWTAAATMELLASERLVNVRALRMSYPPFSDDLFGVMAASPHLGQLRELRVFGVQGEEGIEAFMRRGLPLEVLQLEACEVGDASLRALARSPTPSTLHTLQLSDCELTDAGVEDLARAYAPRLVRLDLSDNDLTARAAEALAGARDQPPLESLSLSRCPVGDGGVVALTRSGRLDGCRELFLGRTGLGDAGLEALSSLTDVSNLTQLELEGNAIGRRGVRAFAARAWPALVALDLWSNRVDGRGVIALLRAEWLGSLTRLILSGNVFEEPLGAGPTEFVEDRSAPGAPLELDLGACGLSADAVTALSRTRRLGGVASLTLDENPLSREAADALGSSPHLSGLVALSLVSCGLGDEGFAALVSGGQSGPLAGLEVLSLGRNGLTDASARAMSRAGFMGLRELSVQENLIGGGWAEAIAQAPGFASLEGLVLSENPLHDGGLERLARSPHLRLGSLELSDVEAGEQGLVALVTGRVMGGLERLSVEDNGWSDEVTLALAGSSSCQALRSLDVDEWSWSEVALAALATSPNLPSLEWVDVDQGEALYALLRRLRVSDAPLTPWAARIWARELAPGAREEE